MNSNREEGLSDLQLMGQALSLTQTLLAFSTGETESSLLGSFRSGYDWTLCQRSGYKVGQLTSCPPYHQTHRIWVPLGQQQHGNKPHNFLNIMDQQHSSALQHGRDHSRFDSQSMSKAQWGHHRTLALRKRVSQDRSISDLFCNVRRDEGQCSQRLERATDIDAPGIQRRA
ncbi:MAG: hypothetical protein J3Q66DRAFT_185601 [Benniella sp.]|nr:MAG: hypothetical protein J3Q66DRAFT_185601 [Benniella sp.]